MSTPGTKRAHGLTEFVGRSSFIGKPGDVRDPFMGWRVSLAHLFVSLAAIFAQPREHELPRTSGDYLP